MFTCLEIEEFFLMFRNYLEMMTIYWTDTDWVLILHNSPKKMISRDRGHRQYSRPRRYTRTQLQYISLLQQSRDVTEKYHQGRMNCIDFYFIFRYYTRFSDSESKFLRDYKYFIVWKKSTVIENDYLTGGTGMSWCAWLHIRNGRRKWEVAYIGIYLYRKRLLRFRI